MSGAMDRVTEPLPAGDATGTALSFDPWWWRAAPLSRAQAPTPPPTRADVAIVGAGIAGLCCASLLRAHHDITVFEAGSTLGGHSNTVDVDVEGRRIPVDTGFIVFNRRNYPNFSALLDRLGLESIPAPMSFSVRCDRTGMEYGGQTIGGVLAQPTNLLRPSFLRLVRDIARLGRTGPDLLRTIDDCTTVADLCATGRFSRAFLDYYLIPMGAAIWSAPRDAVMRFPAKFFLRFFDSHGMLDLRNRPQWRTIRGGSRRYVERISEPFIDACRLDCPVTSVRRGPEGVEITSRAGRERFDQVVLASHADQSLAMLADATEAEAEVLSALPFQPNDAVLHTDASVLPRSRRAWSGWNYRIDGDDSAPVAVTYNLTMLQSLGTRDPVCVTLNDCGAIDPARVLGRFRYHHPVYTVDGIAARARWSAISGVDRRTHYCGAYWLNGFHEDGVNSALAVCRALGVSA